MGCVLNIKHTNFTSLLTSVFYIYIYIIHASIPAFLSHEYKKYIIHIKTVKLETFVFLRGVIVVQKKNSERSHFYMNSLEDLSNYGLLLQVALCEWADLRIPIEPPASYHKIMSKILKRELIMLSR